MIENDVSSGFLDISSMSGEQSFSNLCEIYVSASGYERLFRCQRYSRLHILKALKPEYIGCDFYEQALRKEFDIAYQLEHPHICRALGWETLPDLGHCIIMEYIDGVTLKEYMQRGLLTSQLARKIIAELCNALYYLHGKQIVHRDLKLENILITHNGDNVKLIDFGLSDCDDYDALKIPAGTRYYLAPEALKVGQPLDIRMDIYSLGIIIGKMAECLGDKELAKVSRKCTRRKPEDRYASALEVVKAIEHKYYFSPSFRWLAVGVSALFLLCIAGYAVFSSWSTSTTSVALPVYGNYSIPEAHWHFLRDMPEKDSVFEGKQKVLDEEFPLSVQRKSKAYSVHKELDLLR